MTFYQKLKYAFVCLRAIPWLIKYPWFGFQLLIKRLSFTFTRRFCGETLVCKSTNEKIFNIQSLMTYWEIYSIEGLGNSWHKQLREKFQPIVFDIGANIGMFGRMILNINPTARVIAIDPIPGMRDCNKHAYNFHEFALGKDVSPTNLIFGNGWTASTKEDFYKGKIISVNKSTLDWQWENHGSKEIDILKIDVDGSELDILAGAKACLEHVKVIIIEVISKELRDNLPKTFKWKTINGYDYIGTKI